MLVKAMVIVRNFLETKDRTGKLFKYSMAIVAHAQRLIFNHNHYSMITKQDAEEIILASLLYAIGDKKKTSTPNNYENAKLVLSRLLPVDSPRKDYIIHMIDLISVTSNGNFINTKEPIWFYYPRFAVRLEQIGEPGIQRLKDQSVQRNIPMFLDSTARIKSQEELETVAVPSRFLKYIFSLDASASFIDHLYDKILHLGTLDAFGNCENPYLLSVALERHKYLVDYILNFGHTNDI